MKKKRSGSFEKWVEIPITIHYDAQPAERMTRHYPGCPAHIELTTVEFNGKPIDEAIGEYITKEYEDSIIEDCWDDVE